MLKYPLNYNCGKEYTEECDQRVTSPGRRRTGTHRDIIQTVGLENGQDIIGKTKSVRHAPEWDDAADIRQQ